MFNAIWENIRKMNFFQLFKTENENVWILEELAASGAVPVPPSGRLWIDPHPQRREGFCHKRLISGSLFVRRIMIRLGSVTGVFFDRFLEDFLGRFLEDFWPKILAQKNNLENH